MLITDRQWHKWQKYWRRCCRTLSRAQSLAARRLLDVLSLGLLDALSLFLACCIVWLFHIFLSSSMSVSESRVPSRVSLAPLGLLSCPMASAAPGAELWEPEEGATPSVWQWVVAGGPCWWGAWLFLAGLFGQGSFAGWLYLLWLFLILLCMAASAAWGSWRRVCTDWDEPLMTCPPAVAPLWTAAPLGWVRALTRWRRPLRWSPLCCGGQCWRCHNPPAYADPFDESFQRTQLQDHCATNRENERCTF